MPSEVLLRGKVSWFIGDVDADIPAAPNIAIVPADWTAIGEPYIDDDGVQFALPSTQEDETVNGQTLPVDSYRTFEQPSLGGNVKDFSAEVLSKALNSNAITTTPPTAANRWLPRGQPGARPAGDHDGGALPDRGQPLRHPQRP